MRWWECPHCGKVMNHHGKGSHLSACGPLICLCETPNPHPIGECLNCGRLIPSMAHIR